MACAPTLRNGILIRDAMICIIIQEMGRAPLTVTNETTMMSMTRRVNRDPKTQHTSSFSRHLIPRQQGTRDSSRWGLGFVEPANTICKHGTAVPCCRCWS